MVEIYLIRHGKTMFNTLGRTQGWCDTPLTKKGEEGITELGLGLKEAGVRFDGAYTSDSGRTIQTLNIILKYSENEGIPHTSDSRIREWCFGSYEGGYDGELFGGILPRVFVENSVNGDNASYEEFCMAIKQIDTANWAEDWTTLRGRIIGGFTEIAETANKAGMKRIVIVSHGMTIGTFVNELHPKHLRPHGLDNGSVTRINFENGQFTFLGEVGDMSYRMVGRKAMIRETL